MELLIVDDEAYIVDWLFDLLHEQFPELTVRRAYSGIQAMHMVWLIAMRTIQFSDGRGAW